MKKLRFVSMITSRYPIAAMMVGVYLASLCLIGCAGRGGVKEKADTGLQKEDIQNPPLEEKQKEPSLEPSNEAAQTDINIQIKDSVPDIQLLGREENPMRYPFKIRFATGKIIDIRDIDPYRDLPYKQLQDIHGGYERLYDLTELSKREQEAALSGARINAEAYRDGNYLRILTKAPVIEVQNGITAIAYHASFYSNIEDILATKGHTLIYDHNGNLLQDIKDDQDGFYDIRLSADGQYLMQKYGTAYGEDGGGQLEMGFKFYDTSTGEMVFDCDLGKDNNLMGYGFIEEQPHLGTSFSLTPQKFEYSVYDVFKRELYKYSGTRSQFEDTKFMQGLFKELLQTGNSRQLLNHGFIKK